MSTAVLPEPEIVAREHDFHCPKHLRRVVRELSRLRAWRSLAAIGFHWLAIVACFVVAGQHLEPLLWLGLAVVVALQQNALLVLMHEAAHGRLLARRQTGDVVANWCIAYPLLLTIENFRRDHLAHHFNLNTEHDPDLRRKLLRPGEWRFPKSRWALLGLLACDFMGRGVLDMVRAVCRLSGKQTQENRRRRALGRLAFYFLALTAITALGIWWQIVLLWLVPFFTLVPMQLRIRAMAEHFGLPADHQLNATRNTLCPFWEQAVIAPYNINYHLDHHLFPSIPWYNLPALHEHLSQLPDYQERASQCDRYLGLSSSAVFAQLTTAPDALEHDHFHL